MVTSSRLSRARLALWGALVALAVALLVPSLLSAVPARLRGAALELSPVAANPSASGVVNLWASSSDKKLRYRDVDGTTLVFSAPGGDVSGTFAAMVVNGLGGRPLNTDEPAANDLLRWSGTEWGPAAMGAGLLDGLAPPASRASGGATSAIAGGATRYLASSLTASTSDTPLVIFTEGSTLRRLFCFTETAPGSGQSATYTVRKYTGGSWADTTITCTVSGTGKTCSDLLHTGIVSAGDMVGVKAVQSASSVAAGVLCTVADTH